MTAEYRSLADADAGAVLELNDEAVRFLSPLDAERLQALRGMASLAVVAEVDGEVAGFLLALEDGTAYDSVNYRWFTERFKRFLYVDRVVVDARRRGLGTGDGFYRLAEAHARERGCLWLVAEIDIEPPNPGSLRFHDKRGFVELGRHRVTGGKEVSLRARGLG